MRATLSGVFTAAGVIFGMLGVATLASYAWRFAHINWSKPWFGLLLVFFALTCFGLAIELWAARYKDK